MTPEQLQQSIIAEGQTRDVMQSQQASRGALDYSALLVAEASQSDLGPLEFERYRRTIREISAMESPRVREHN